MDFIPHAQGPVGRVGDPPSIVGDRPAAQAAWALRKGLLHWQWVYKPLSVRKSETYID